MHVRRVIKGTRTVRETSWTFVHYLRRVRPLILIMGVDALRKGRACVLRVRDLFRIHIGHNESLTVKLRMDTMIMVMSEVRRCIGRRWV